MFAELVEYRELLVRMTLRDLMLRYKQTVMGFGWAIFMPLLNTVIFSVVFMRVAPIETGVPYPLFAFCGLLCWNFFASSLRFAVNSLTSNVSLVTKVYFPREIFPVSAVIVCFVDFVVGGIVLVLMMLYYGTPVTAALCFLPAVVAVQLAFTFGIALMLAMGNLFYRDVKYLFDVVITVWMFATAVVYPVELVGGDLGRLMMANPMTPILEAYRAILLKGEMPPAGPFLFAAAAALATLSVAWLMFHRGEFEFAEYV
jgi:ABC-2 type transport system permease protein/lipopolysaccharide transport system permease protein